MNFYIEYIVLSAMLCAVVTSSVLSQPSFQSSMSEERKAELEAFASQFAAFKICMKIVQDYVDVMQGNENKADHDHRLKIVASKSKWNAQNCCLHYSNFQLETPLKNELLPENKKQLNQIKQRFSLRFFKSLTREEQEFVTSMVDRKIDAKIDSIVQECTDSLTPKK